MRTRKLQNMLQLVEVKRPKGVQVKVDSNVLTAGHARKVRLELYEEPWSESGDFILVGDLIEVPDPGDQRVEFKHCMQAGQCNHAASLLQHPCFP